MSDLTGLSVTGHFVYDRLYLAIFPHPAATELLFDVAFVPSVNG